ncbi:hypothetical protein [Glaciimonas sp. PCH181]|nr:hypothetical protein [Glaciimonas sp. PCH181]
MKKLLKLAVLGALLSTMLAGCIVVPARGGYYERPYHENRY